jgi:hypothetical protein
MAVNTVNQREIVEVPFVLPGNQIKIHPALVLSTEQLSDAESGMFYAVLISTKQLNPEFTLRIENEWLNKPMTETSFFVTHIVSFFQMRDVIKSSNRFVKQKYFDNILFKVIHSMFNIELEQFYE